MSASSEKTPSPPSPKTLSCPSCGSSLTIRAPGHSLSVACSSCGSVLDPNDPDYKVIAKFKKGEVSPRIPLGKRGKVRGESYEVIGYLMRTSEADGVPFSWNEYLLFNPYLGFRWLTEYQGHWIIAKAASGSPSRESKRGTQSANYLGESYRLFQTSTAEVAYVMGEFPWRVKAGEKAAVEDFVSPPRVLSCEKTENEVNWSIGEYIEGADLWKAFGLEGSPPLRHGVGVAQPSPYQGQRRGICLLAAGLVGAVFAIQTFFLFFSQNRTVFENRFSYVRGAGNPASAALVTESFELTGRRSNVRIDIDTDLSNNWAYFHMAIVGEDTGRALNFGREVSYYFGRDSDGSWTEGGKGDKAYLPSVESGRYYMLIEPETNAPRVNYRVKIRRDVPRLGHMFCAMFLVAVPPLFFLYRMLRFEYQRWSESDHPMFGGIGKSGDGDDDD